MAGTLRGFVPWIAFAALSSTLGWETGAITAAVLSVVLLVWNVRTGHGLDENVIELSAMTFFLAIAVAACLKPHSALREAVGPLSSGWLALTAWGSLAFSRPFTMGIARRSVPPAFWETPQFRRANVVITAAWAVSFTVTALATGALDYATSHSGTATTLVQIAGYAAPAVFTVRYQNARRRDADRVVRPQGGEA